MIVFSKKYSTDLTRFGVDKPFALDRGELVLSEIQRELACSPNVLEPEPVSIEDVLRVHTPEYLQTLSDERTWVDIFELKEDEYHPDAAVEPLSNLLDDIRLKCGGTKLACQLALKLGLAVNLGGGYHHAFPNEGRGFCALNDVAIAIRALQASQRIRRALIVDLDFHQGDGTALIFQNDPNVFTYSVHSEEGWPPEKQVSDLDIAISELQAGNYLQLARSGLLQCLERFTPDIAVYIAGSDPYEKDVLPGTRFINLTLEELEERDRFVIDTLYERKIPTAMVFAGGYGPDVWEVHYRAVRHLLIKGHANTQEPVPNGINSH